MPTAPRLLGTSLLALCLGAGCAATAPARPPLQRAAYAGISLGVLPVAPQARGARAGAVTPLSLYVVLENASGPDVSLDPSDFSLGPVRGSACSPVTVEPVAAVRSPAAGSLYAQAGRTQLLAAWAPAPAAPSPAALLDLELTPGSLSAPARTAGVLTFPCFEQGTTRPILLRWRVRDLAGAQLGEIAVPVLP